MPARAGGPGGGGAGEPSARRGEGSLQPMPENPSRGAGPRVFFTSKNLPGLFGVSNSAWRQHILEDPLYGFEMSSITRDKLLSAPVFQMGQEGAAGPVSCGIFRVRSERAPRVELVARKVREKDGRRRLYLFYYDREAQQQDLEARVDRAMRMGRAGQDRLRDEMEKQREAAARRESELALALRAQRQERALEVSAFEDRLAGEKNRTALLVRQLEKARAAQRQAEEARQAEARQREEAFAAEKKRLEDALARGAAAEAARQILEEQLREARERARLFEDRWKKEEARRILLEDQMGRMGAGQEGKALPTPLPLLPMEGPATPAIRAGAAPLYASAAGPAPAAREGLGAPAAAGPAPAAREGLGAPAAAGHAPAAREGLGAPAAAGPAPAAREGLGAPAAAGHAPAAREGDWMAAAADGVTVFSAPDPEPERRGMSAPQWTLCKKTFNIGTLVEEILAEEDRACADKAITLRLYRDTRLPERVEGFGDLLARALREMVRNAVDRTGAGGLVQVHLRAGKPAGGFLPVAIRVEDAGKSLPGDMLQAIPEESLPAAGEAAALMGGSLDVRSDARRTRISLALSLRAYAE